MHIQMRIIQFYPPVDQFLIMPLHMTWILWRPDAFHQAMFIESKRKDLQGQKHQKSRQRLYNETKVQYTKHTLSVCVHPVSISVCRSINR